MPVIRYTNEVEVQGWEPALDGGVDASLDAVAAELPSNFGTNSTTNPPRRQVPPTRARAATCPDIHNFTFMPRQGPSSSIPQNNSAMTESGAPGPGPSTSSSSSFSSSRNAAAAGRSGSRPRSSTERKIARKLAENANYVPRPRNSFILFRTEFVAQRTNGGTQSSSGSKSDADDDDDTTQSLSKQASAVWNKMTDEEKKPFVERAKLEKAAHEAKYPHYRYKPVRHNSARKNGPLPPPGRSGLTPFHGPSLSLPRGNSEPLAAQAMDTNDDGLPHNTIMEVDGQHVAAYQSSSTVVEMSAPAPRKLSLSSSSSTSSSSSLANALESRSPTPGSTNGYGLSLPSVPPVPILTFNMQPGPLRVSGLPPIPRSPSAPVFDRHVVGQFPHTHQHQHLVPPTSQSQYPTFTNPFSVGSNFAAAARRASPSIGNVISPVSSAAESDVTVPTPENTEPDHFHDFVRRDSDNTTAGPTSSSSPALFAVNQRLFTNNETYNEQSNDNTGNTHSSSSSSSNSNSSNILHSTTMTTHYEMDEMDIDMRALLNLSPVPEVSESANGGGVSGVQRPFEAIAALWVQDQQLQLQAQQQHREPANEEVIVSQNQSQGQMEMQTQTPVQAQASSRPSSFSGIGVVPTSVASSASSPGQPEIGLDTYSLAVSGSDSNSSSNASINTNSTGTNHSSSVTGSDFDYFSSCISSSTSTSGASCLEDDLFRLDLDFIRPTSSSSASSAAAHFSCALDSGSALSGLADEDVFGSYNYNLSNGDSAIVGDMLGYGFGYDRERGLYGGLALGAGADSIGFGYGMEYGL